jgi:guanylate kinase
MATSPTAGRVVVISGPSGVGKTTVVQQLFPLCPRLVHSVSATTRPPRPDEVHGRDYYFINEAEFATRRAAGEFLECCEVFGRGYWYGTLWSEVTTGLAAGKWVVLEIDVQGAMTVLQRFPDAVTIFIRPESFQELERRLRGRRTESEDAVERRLTVARREMDAADRYQYQVLNRSVDQAVEEIRAIFHDLDAC